MTGPRRWFAVLRPLLVAALPAQFETMVEKGHRLTLDLSLAQGQPTFMTFDQKTYSGVDPSFHRFYRGDWAVGLVQSSATGVDRARRVELTASGPLLGRLLDGSQELVSVGAVPWYRRDTFLP